MMRQHLCWKMLFFTCSSVIMGHSLFWNKYSFTYCFGIRNDCSTPF
jgi:hypothetical protein